MVDKYDPTTDIHNLFVFAMVPLLIHASLSFNYEGFMGSKYLFAVVELITFAIYTVLPTVFVITTLISTSTIVTNSILAIFAFPVYYCYHDIKDRLSSPSPPSPPPSYSQENFDSFVDKLVTKSSFDYTLYKDDYWKQKFPDNDGDIRKYYDFGKAFEDRLKELKKSDIKERLARALVYEEILAPYDMDQKITIEKELFIAQRIYEFFNEIGEDKIQETSLTAKEICDIDINYILSHLTERHIKKIREKKQMIQEEDQEGKDQEKEKGQAMVIEMEEKAK
ncbi:hypothetical protein GLOIN_2v1768737 [Rhizophagus clarus]|uniref:Uncharacterized protein n=1 Tax=Rhizophagus clarus TaxID=94130 RepID=A0A8H3LD68_9GLOM|nr:hypothetical protein GLOIN_2v1768737 [Rhizophagus clarus]